MKAKLLIKCLMGGSLSIVVLAPTLTMTSCASISQWTLPISIGGDGDASPWSELWNDESTRGLVDSEKHQYSENSQYSSPSNAFSSYLPNKYITYSQRSGTTENYAFATPYNDKNWNKNDDQSYYDSQWISSQSTDVLKYSESFDMTVGTDKKNVSVVTAMNNLNTYSSLSFNSIASAINTYSSGLLHLMTQNGVMNNKYGNDDWYNALFGKIGSATTGGLNHGDKTTPENKTFYEFLFDLLDNLSQGKVDVKYAQSGINFKFDSKIFGPGPYVSTANEKDLAKSFERLVSGTIAPFTEDDITSNIVKDGAISPDFVYNLQTSREVFKPSTMAAYTSFAIPATSTIDKDNLKNNIFYPSAISKPIPFIITPEGSTYSYYNPLTNHSFQTNDYLIDNISSVQNQIAKTNAWNNFSQHVDTEKSFPDKKKWAESLSYSFVNQETSAENVEPFFPSTGTNDFSQNLLNRLGADATYLEPSISFLFDEQKQENSNLANGYIKPNSYIAFANYSFVPYPRTDDSSKNIQYDLMPVFNGMATDSSTGAPAVFPISLLFDLSGNPTQLSDQNIDTSLFQASLMPEADALYNYKPSDGSAQPYHNDDFKNSSNKMWYFDLSKIFAKQTKICDIFSKNINIDEKPTDYFNNNKAIFQVLWNLFSNWNYTESDGWELVPTESNIVFIPQT
ncbi:MAG: hypothetical protein LBF00_01510 [Mycoplasmataceae bacterium]|nr:hypothetical protein [Mycoplasmataceae bacterium]